MIRPTVVVLGVLLSGLWVQAQSSSGPAFDVASVRANHSDAEPASFVQPGGRYTATNVTLRTLLKSAYGLHDEQLLGGPDWINTERFDVIAKAEGYATASAFRDQARLMLRPLLAERFKLAVRREQRELPVYALVKAGRELGRQIRPSDARGCDAGPKALAPVPGAAEPEAPLPCGAEIYRPGHLAARDMAFSNLLLNISRYTDRVVVNRTGLEGKFDWEIQWVPDSDAVGGASPPDGPALYQALREQTGFRIERQRSPIDVMVVERAERPIPD